MISTPFLVLMAVSTLICLHTPPDVDLSCVLPPEIASHASCLAEIVSNVVGLQLDSNITAAVLGAVIPPLLRSSEPPESPQKRAAGRPRARRRSARRKRKYKSGGSRNGVSISLLCDFTWLSYQRQAPAMARAKRIKAMIVLPIHTFPLPQGPCSLEFVSACYDDQRRVDFVSLGTARSRRTRSISRDRSLIGLSTDSRASAAVLGLR